MRLVLVEALRVQAMIALRQERRLARDGLRAVGDQSLWEVAEHSLDEGLALARELPYPYAEARLLHVSAQMHIQRGELEPARARLEGALAVFRRLGARQDTAQVDRALASLSQNPSPSQNTPGALFEPQVTEAQWALIAALLPPRAGTGRPRADDRRVLEAILYKQRTSCAWAAVPAALGDGATAHRRWRAWAAAGVWAQVAAIVQTTPPVPAEERPARTDVSPPLEGG
jgi:transposase